LNSIIRTGLDSFNVEIADFKTSNSVPYLEQGIKSHPKVFVGSFVGRRGSQNPHIID
jgi:hypothetical protein